MWSDLIGKKIVGFRGYAKSTLDFILFDDKKSYLELEEQDTYDYHDCNLSARRVTLRQNEKAWSEAFTNLCVFEGNTSDPF